MANILEDSSVVPSYLGLRSQGEEQDPGHQTNLSLRTGEVREIVYPDDPKNVNRRFIEYVVEVQEKDGNGPGTSTRYANCVLSNPLGSVADIFRYTLREDDKNQAPEDGIGVGAKVLVLCVNGQTARGVIIGGLRDTGTDKEGTKQQGKDSKDDGHNLFFEFNGVQISINKDGELKVMYRGATKVDGTLDDNANADAEGSTVIFNKDGGIKAYTKDEAQFVFLDHANKKIDILADEEWHVKVNKKISVEAGDTITIRGDAGIDVTASNDVTIKSSGVKVGDATDAWMLGSTYRQAEGQMNQQLSGYLTSLATAISTAATALQAAATAQKVPIGGAVAASIPLQAAATALTSAGPLLSQMGSAITSFESNGSSYLSKKNKND